MARTFRNVAAFSVAIFIAGNAGAQVETDASVSLGLAGSEADVQLAINPSFSATYQANTAIARTSWTTGLVPLSENWWTGQWTADNQLQWATASQQLSGNFAYIHSESDILESPLINDTAQTGLNISLPWSPTFRNILSLGVNWQQVSSSESDQTVDDTTLNGSYSLSWQPAKFQAWQVGLSRQHYNSGADITGLQTQWQLNGAQVSLNTALTLNNTQQANTETQFIGGQVVASHQSPLARTSISLERAQTDALMQFEISFIDETILQQSQILLNEISVEVADILLFRSLLLSFTYRQGQTESLQRIDLIDFEDAFESDFAETRLDLLMPFANQSTLAVAVEHSEQNNDAVSRGSISYGRSLNRQFSFGANYSQNFTAEPNYRWLLSLDYAL